MLSRRDKLVSHIKTQHPGSPIPPPSFIRNTENQKVSTHAHTNISFPCPFCEKILSRRDKLNKHIKNIHSELKIDGSGKLCPEQSDNKENIDSEQKTLISEDLVASTKPKMIKSKSKPTPCPFCSAVLSRTDKLTKHIEKKHPGKNYKPSTKSSKNDTVLKKKDGKKKRENAPKAWDLLWNSKEPVFVKFDFSKKLSKRKRKVSEITVDLNEFDDLSKSSEPEIKPQDHLSRLVNPPKQAKVPVKKKIQILEAFKYK